MEYLLLIYHSEANWGKMTPADEAAIYREYGQLRDDLSGKGKFLGGSQLTPTTMATTVRACETANAWSPMAHSRKPKSNWAAISL